MEELEKNEEERRQRGEEDALLRKEEARQAEEAKKAGADIVGGLELVEGVRFSSRLHPLRTP